MKTSLLFSVLLFTFLFARAQSDGTLDVTFSTDGILTYDNGNTTPDDARDLLIMADKSIIVGGTSAITTNDFSFIALTSNGSLNTAFSDDGQLQVDVSSGSNDSLQALALDSTQNIVAAGFSTISGTKYMVVMRVHADGTLDTDFGTDGIALLNPALSNAAYDVAIQPDGKIVVAGTVYDGLTPIKACVVRLNEDGTYDGAFGDNGVWEGSPDPTYDVFVYSVAIQSDGKIVIGGYQNVNGDDQFALGRILPGGSMDTGFDADGWITKNITVDYVETIHALVIQPDGKIVIAGETAGEIVVCRFNDDGSDDTGFAASGTFTDPLLDNDDYLYDLTLQPDGKIIAVGGGSINDNVDFLIIRLTTDGVLDADFGDGGIVYTDFIFNNEFAYGVALQPDLKIVVAGTAVNGYETDFAVARYGNGFTGVEDVADDDGIVVYPNPGDGKFLVKISDDRPKIQFYEVKDLSGRVLRSGSTDITKKEISIDLRTADKGVYLLEVRTACEEPPTFTSTKLIIVN